MAFAISHLVRLSPLRGSDEHTNMRFFNRAEDRLRLYISISCPGVRCIIRIAMQDDAALVHANLARPDCCGLRNFRSGPTLFILATNPRE